MKSSPPPLGQLELIESVPHWQGGVDEVPLVMIRYEPDGSISTEEACRIMGADIRIVRRVQRVLELGPPDLWLRMRDGKTTIEQAEREIEKTFEVGGDTLLCSRPKTLTIG